MKCLLSSVLMVLILFSLHTRPRLSLAQGMSVPTIPKINITLDKSNTPKDVSTGLQILFLLTILSLAPAILIMVTSFTRIVVVLSFFRQALGTHQLPTNQIIIGLSLFLTFFVMSPIIKQINADALQPYHHCGQFLNLPLGASAELADLPVLTEHTP